MVLVDSVEVDSYSAVEAASKRSCRSDSCTAVAGHPIRLDLDHKVRLNAETHDGMMLGSIGERWSMAVECQRVAVVPGAGSHVYRLLSCHVKERSG